jgi:predicted RNA-binding protein with PIN domain
MSRINDIALTPQMQAALLQWLAGLPDADVAGAGEVLPGGFRKPDLIRERLKAIIEGPATLPPWLLGRIVTSFRACAMVSSLSVQALRQHFDIIAVVADPPVVLVAMAADDRPEVRRLAAEHLCTSSQTFSEEEKANACEVYLDLMGNTFMELAAAKVIRSVKEDGELALAVEDAEMLEEELDEQTQLVDELTEKLEKERSGRANDRRQLTAAAKAGQDRLGKEISQLKQQANTLASQKASLERKLQDLERAKAEAIKSAVQSELAVLDRQWLAEAMGVQSVVAETSAADLLARAQAALEAQKAQDRHSGNRLELGRRLEELRRARQQLQDARQNAINPVCELAAVTEQVDGEIARLENKLGVPRPHDDFLGRLLQQINGAGDLDTLHAASTLVDSLCEVRLVAAGQPRQAYAALQRRHDILLAQLKRGGQESPDHWLSFPSLLHQDRDCLLLLDGHNVLFALDYLQPHFENGVPGSNARKRLVELVQRLIRGRAQAHARIVFDGPSGSVETVGPNLKVEFSGGIADQRADDAIIRHLAQKSLQELKRRTFVVTNDRELQRRIRTHNAYYMPAGAFDLMLQKFNCL